MVSFLQMQWLGEFFFLSVAKYSLPSVVLVFLCFYILSNWCVSRSTACDAIAMGHECGSCVVYMIFL